MIERDANAITPNPAAAPSSPENEEAIAREALDNWMDWATQGTPLQNLHPSAKKLYEIILGAVKSARQQPVQKDDIELVDKVAIEIAYCRHVNLTVHEAARRVLKLALATGEPAQKPQ